MEYGGWYDNPATGQNQRWWNGTWTGGSDPGGSSSSGGNYRATSEGIYESMKASISEAIDKLVEQTNGDYDFAIKWLEHNYKEAVGTDDGMRKEILREVADDLEKKVGTIGYDYETGKYRIETQAKTESDRLNENTDLGIKRLGEDSDLAVGRYEENATRQTGRLTSDTSTAMARLKEDEQVLTERYNKESDMARRLQGSDLNQRGILAGTREQAGGLAGREVGLLEGDIRDKYSALSRSVGRDTYDINQNQARGLEDINTTRDRGVYDVNQSKSRGLYDYGLNRDRGLFDIGQAKEWGLQDLGTTTRRGYANAEGTYDMSSEQYARTRDRQLAELEARKREQEAQARTTAESMARYQTGAY